MTTALWLCFTVAGCWLLGLAMVRGLSRWLRVDGSEPLPWEETAGLSLLLGVGGTSWGLFVWSLAGGPLDSVVSRSLAGLGTLLGLLTLRTKKEPDARQLEAPAASRAAIRVLQGLAVVIVVGAMVQAGLTPQRLWDERAIFGIKSLVLHRDGSVHSPLLHHPDFAQYHPKYPLLLPLAEQHVYAVLGEANDRWGKIIPPLLGLGLMLTFAGVIGRRSDRARGWLFGLLLIAVPCLTFWEYGLPSAQADAPLACLHGLSALYVWDWLRGGVGSRSRMAAIVAGLAAGLAIFTKDEGIAFFLVDAAALAGIAACAVLFGRLGRDIPVVKRSLAAGLRCLAAMLLIVLPWLWHRRGLPDTTEMSYFGRLSGDALSAGAATLPWSLRHLVSRMFREAFEWGLQWWGMLAGLLLAPRRALHPSQCFLLLDVVGALAALVVAGMLAPTPVEEHLGGSSHRFLIQLTPVAVLFLAGQFIERKAQAEAIAPEASDSPASA